MSFALEAMVSLLRFDSSIIPEKEDFLKHNKHENVGFIRNIVLFVCMVSDQGMEYFTPFSEPLADQYQYLTLASQTPARLDF